MAFTTALIEHRLPQDTAKYGKSAAPGAEQLPLLVLLLLLLLLHGAQHIFE
jgi:hypothetical protein